MSSCIRNNSDKGAVMLCTTYGTFAIKYRKENTARNISKNTTIVVPAHDIPAFKPSPDLCDAVK
ncbi:HU family DNA-binding protein [Alistipes provencensis]|uniref:HU family DNA-binding protein n=1 Tax=Alistipes provencensis TaxID=1816676 RepID=UPI00373FD806